MELTEVRRTGVVKRRPVLGPIVTSAARDDAGNSVDPGAGLPFRLTAETRNAIEAVQFVAAHLKNEDDYAEVTVSYHREGSFEMLHQSYVSNYTRCPAVAERADRTGYDP